MKKDKKDINVTWLYPDILNNFGDRGNIEAIEKIGSKIGLNINVFKVNTYEDEIPFETSDIILLGSGELRVMPRIVDRLNKDIDRLKTYIEENKYIFVFNLTASIFAKKTIRREDQKDFEGLSLLPLTIREKRYNYGDDIDLNIYNGMNIIGSQIQMADYILDEDAKYFGDVNFGYGNDFYSGKCGARFKNLIFPNVQGPLLFKNPWYLEFVLEDIISSYTKSNEYIKNFNIDKYKDKYEFEVKALKAAKKYIDVKPKPPKSEYKNEYLL